MERPSNKIVSIVIVTAGVKDYFWSLLDSIKKQTYSAFEIIVIDNSLNPHFGREINERYPDIKLYSGARNLFYCGAVNKGIEISRGDFFCLNDDVILDRKFIEEALRGFSIDERIGMVNGEILRFDRKTIDSTGLFLSP